MRLGQSGVVVVELVLDAAGQGHHGQVVGVGDGVDVAGQAQAEIGQGDALGQTAAGGGALDVEGRTAGGLADGADDLLADLAESFDQAHGGGGLALPPAGWG